jgi:UDP-N-acetylmuramoyl-L-alanyl-D-glutamate--2,6-diaminopimelate ligase
MHQNCTLEKICFHFNIYPENGVPLKSIVVTGVVSDSRITTPGNVFFAWKGGSFDSHQFMDDAIQRGAIAIVGTEPLHGVIPVPYFRVDDSRYWLAGFAAYLNDFPAKKLVMIGVTGTDGKTTTTNYIFHILQAAGLKVGMISTVNAVIGDRIIDTGFHVTTPEAVEVQHYLTEMVEAGVTHVVLEATSHGLAQHRTAFCEFDMGVVTNVTHEHLDYHGSYDGYLASKAILFENLTGAKHKDASIPPLAVLNITDRSYPLLKETTKSIKQITYGLTPNANLWADRISNDEDGIRFQSHLNGEIAEFHTYLHGEYNVLNCLAAIGITYGGLKIPLKAIQQGISRLKQLSGRMESINFGQSFQAIVDFAHTPFALEAALSSARKTASGRLIAVFGSAGLRDKQKRRMMALVAADLADITILTAEDPRTESLDGILAEMSSAMQEKGKVVGKDYFVVPDRGNAIRMAVQIAQAGDLVIACGKGHEQSMCFGITEYAWDEKTAMQAALAELLGVIGPEMPYLPTHTE